MTMDAPIHFTNTAKSTLDYTLSTNAIYRLLAAAHDSFIILIASAWLLSLHHSGGMYNLLLYPHREHARQPHREAGILPN